MVVSLPTTAEDAAFSEMDGGASRAITGMETLMLGSVTKLTLRVAGTSEESEETAKSSPLGLTSKTPPSLLT